MKCQRQTLFFARRRRIISQLFDHRQQQKKISKISQNDEDTMN